MKITENRNYINNFIATFILKANHNKDYSEVKTYTSVPQQCGIVV